jgi:hypothetical protein
MEKAMSRFVRGLPIVVGVVALAAAAASVELGGQDPDEGAVRGRPLAAYRPAVPGVHGLVTAGHPLSAMAGAQVLMKGATRSTRPSRSARR